MTDSNPITAYVNEIFSSVQGEGLQIGRRQLFVRFCECHRRCLYCDTNIDRTEHILIEDSPGSEKFISHPNPLTPEQLIQFIIKANRPEYAHDDLFITGGEPLLYAPFLKAILPELRDKTGLPIHVETSGDKPEEFRSIAGWIDHVLMDIKLPSVTKEAATWDEHFEFLKEIRRTETDATIKLVVSADTETADLEKAAELIRLSRIESAVVLQPMTATLQTDDVPTAQQILGWQAEMACSLGRTVRVIPQCHKHMGLL
jgi:organic radical activating enzyme